MKVTTCTRKNKGQVNILASLRNDSKHGNPFCMTTFIYFASSVPTTPHCQVPRHTRVHMHVHIFLERPHSIGVFLMSYAGQVE